MRACSKLAGRTAVQSAAEVLGKDVSIVASVNLLFVPVLLSNFSLLPPPLQANALSILCFQAEPFYPPEGMRVCSVWCRVEFTFK